MSAATVSYTQDQLEAMTQNDLIIVAKDSFGLKFPARFTKADRVAALLQAVEGEDLAPYRIPGWAKPQPNFLQESSTTESGLPTDVDANRVVPTPLPTRRPSPEELEARVEAAKADIEVSEAERLRVKAEKSKPKKSVEPTVEELRARSSKIGYAVGVLGWAINRLTKEQVVFDQVAEAMGESLDSEAVSLAREGMIEGYAKAHDQFRMPSAACVGMADDMPEGIWAEIQTGLAATIPTLSIFELLANILPEEVEETTDETPED